MTEYAEKSMIFTALIPAAGSSRRMEGIDKLLVDLSGKPVLIRTLEVFNNSGRIREIIIVTTPDNFDIYKRLVKNFEMEKSVYFAGGGERRQDSVENGLEMVQTEYVAIHDGARPLLDAEVLNRVLDGALGADGCIPVIPVKDTVKIVDTDGFAVGTPDREALYRVQTPQVFKTGELRKAYKYVKSRGLTVSDDSSIMEASGNKIKTVAGSSENIKITTPEDIEIAMMFLKK